MRGCEQFADTPALIGGVTKWLRNDVWGVQPRTHAPSWFEECRDKLLKTFGVACLHSLPSFLPRPSKLDAPLPNAVRTVAKEIHRWVEQTRDHLDCLYQRSSPECQAETEAHWTAFKGATTLLLAHKPMSSNPSGKDKLCESFLKWADLFFLWSRAFSVFERALAECVVRDAAAAASDSTTDAPRDAEDALTFQRLAILQVSPAPWPPWPNGEIPDTSSVAS